MRKKESGKIRKREKEKESVYRMQSYLFVW